MVLFYFIMFVVALLILIKGSDFLVSASAKIAKALGANEFFIGVTIVAIGTSIPELASAIFAAINKNTDLIMGNIIGANIANIGLVLAVGVILLPMLVDEKIYRKDGMFLLLVMVLFFVFAFDKTISMVEGLFLVLMFLVYVFYTLKIKPAEKIVHRSNYLKYMTRFGKLISLKHYIYSLKDSKQNNKSFFYIINKDKEMSFLRNIIIGIIGIVMIYIGARYLVESAISISEYFNVGSGFVGLTIMALGTTMPELTVTIISARKKLAGIMVGNIFGSNIFNTLFIIGVSSLITPLTVTNFNLFFALPYLILMTGVLLMFIKDDWRIKMMEGLIMLIMYIIFISFTLFYAF